MSSVPTFELGTVIVITLVLRAQYSPLGAWPHHVTTGLAARIARSGREPSWNSHAPPGSLAYDDAVGRSGAAAMADRGSAGAGVGRERVEAATAMSASPRPSSASSWPSS